MSYNGAGTFLINSAGQPVVAGTTISETVFNALTADLATGLSTAITKNGQTTPTANIPMGGFKLTGLGTGVANTDAANVGQVTPALITATGATTARSAAAHFADAISVKDFGAVGDGVTDDTAAVQAAINGAQTLGKILYFPAGNYRLTSALTITYGMTIAGNSPVVKGLAAADLFNGTFLYFDHTGKGVNILNTNGAITDILVTDIGTRRNQPAPAASWAPNNHDYDFYCSGVADVTFNNVLLLNPTRGIGVFSGGGRINFYQLRMQAFIVGIYIDTTYDVCRFDQIHQWPFWRDDTNVHTYCMANLDAIMSGRNDNPMLSNIFTIYARSGIRFTQVAAGATSKVHLANADFDRGVYGIYVDSTVTNGITGQFANVTHQGETGVALSKMIFIVGNNSVVDFTNTRTDLCAQNGVRLEGTGNSARFANVAIMNFDQSAAGFPAFEAYAGNKIEIVNKPLIGASGGGGAYANTGTIISDDWRTYTPTITATSGTITTLGTVTALYKIVGNTVSIKFTVGITTNGTGAGAVKITLPISSAQSVAASGIGRESAITGNTFNVYSDVGQSFAALLNYNNSYPGADGVVLNGGMDYIAIV